MFKSFFKLLLFVILLTFLVVAVALVAAPYFVRQDQVKAFIEKNITLPDQKKLKIPGKIKFGLFPYMYFETKEVKIVGKKIPSQIFNDVKLGFNINDIFAKGIDFGIKTKYQNIKYDANIDLVDYKGFYQKGKTPISIKARAPIKFDLKGNLEIDGRRKSFKDFTLNHKKTSVTGTINLETKDSKNIKIEGNVVVDSDNIDDLRRLAFFDKYQDKFNLLEGGGKVVLGFATSGYDPYTYKKNLDAEGSFKLSDVKVYGFDLEEIARNPLEVKFLEDYSRKIDIDSISGIFVIENGLANISEMKAASSRLNVRSEGLVNIADETLNLDVELDLNSETQKIKAPLKVKGSFDKPKIVPKYGKALVDNLPALLEKKGFDVNKLNAETIGKEIFKGGSSKDIKNNLKNLFKGF